MRSRMVLFIAFVASATIAACGDDDDGDGDADADTDTDADTDSDADADADADTDGDADADGDGDGDGDGDADGDADVDCSANCDECVSCAQSNDCSAQLASCQADEECTCFTACFLEPGLEAHCNKQCNSAGDPETTDFYSCLCTTCQPCGGC